MEALDIFKALAKAQPSFGPAIKDANNPFFKSKYADIAAVWEACNQAMAENNLFIVQPTVFIAEANQWAVNTRIYHESGGFIEGFLPVIATKQNDPQSFGSAVTYARRYGLAALLGIVTEDDDAEGAMNREDKSTPKTAVKKPEEQVQTPEPKYASARQKEQIIKLLNNRVITDIEKRKMLLNLGKIEEEQAEKSIAKLKKVIEERENEQAPVA